MDRKIDTLDRASQLAWARTGAERHLAVGEWEQAFQAFISRLLAHSELKDHPAIEPAVTKYIRGELHGERDVRALMDDVQ
jgi:hypothetical protein